jgi:O-antigen/teichoic acid export membrane protein
MSSPNPQKLISARSIARSVLWNLSGICAPLVVALVAIPRLIHGMGVDRFGVLTLAWVVVGYFGMFDVGLGRALTKLAAEFLGQNRNSEIPGLFWTSILLTSVLGLLGMAALALLTPWLVGHVLKIPPAIRGEALGSFYVLSLAVPVVIWTGTLRGFLEAHQRFDLINRVRIPLGVFTYASPLLVLPFSVSLFPVVVVLAVGRAAAGAIYGVFCVRVEPRLLKGTSWDRRRMLPLLRFGGWMSVSNVASALMVVADRFVIGAILGMAAVAYYATPYEVVTKVLVIPGAIVAVLFPAFSTAQSLDSERMRSLFRRGAKCTFLVLFPVLLAIVVFARQCLRLWLGGSFAGHSVSVLEWLAVGVLLNGLALVPFSLIQGAGRPDVTARLHLLELVFYAPLLWWLIHTRGIDGAAIAWALRVGVDALALFLLSHRLLATGGASSWRTVATVGGGLGLMGVGVLLPGLLSESIFYLVSLLALILVGWFWLLSSDERGLLQRWAWRAVEVAP